MPEERCEPERRPVGAGSVFRLRQGLLRNSGKILGLEKVCDSGVYFRDWRRSLEDRPEQPSSGEGGWEGQRSSDNMCVSEGVVVYLWLSQTFKELSPRRTRCEEKVRKYIGTGSFKRAGWCSRLES